MKAIEYISFGLLIIFICILFFNYAKELIIDISKFNQWVLK